MSKQPLREFHLFPQLPAELRCAIWQECRPHRVTEVDVVYPLYSIQGTYCANDATTNQNSRRPIITRVCRESRAVALEGTGSVAEGYAKGYDVWYDENRTKYGWVCEATDIIHLNWAEGWGPREDWTTDSPIPVLAWLAPRFVAASIVSENIHCFRSGIITRDDYLVDGHIDEDEEPLPILDYLALWKNYLVTIQMVNLHVSFEQVLESGLFGRLGEECIQLVDPFDEDKIQRYFELWQSGPPEDIEPLIFFNLALSKARFYEEIKIWNMEVDTTWLRHKWYCAKEKNFTGIEQSDQIWLEQKPEESMRDCVFERINGSIKYFYLNRDHSWVKKMLREMPRFTPKIMFRFCPGICYTRKSRRREILENSLHG